jgi:hypothetical protein
MQPVQGSEQFIEMVLQVLGKDCDAFAGQGLDQFDGRFQSLLGLMRPLQGVKRCDRLLRLFFRFCYPYVYILLNHPFCGMVHKQLEISGHIFVP